MRSFNLSENEMNELCRRHETPFLVVSAAKVEENYRFLRAHLPHAGVYYAMKANPAPAILRRLAALGSKFDVASAGEIEAFVGRCRREGVRRVIISRDFSSSKSP